MGILVVLLISAIVVAVFQGAAALIQGVWLSSLLSGLRVWEYSLVGSVSLAPYLSYIIGFGLIIFGIRLLSHTK